MRRLWCWITDHRWAYVGDVKSGAFLLYSLHQCARCRLLELGPPQ